MYLDENNGTHRISSLAILRILWRDYLSVAEDAIRRAIAIVDGDHCELRANATVQDIETGKIVILVFGTPVKDFPES